MRLCKKIILVASLLAALASPAISSAATQPLTVYNWNGTPAHALARWERAVVWQSGQLQHYWKTPRVAFVKHGGWPIYLVDWHLLSATGDLGYHSVLASGQSYATIGNIGGSVVFSHEIMETLVDPQLRDVLALDNQFVLREVCDPVEVNTYSAPNGVELADFITPAWYVLRSHGPWDIAGDLVRSRELQGALQFL